MSEEYYVQLNGGTTRCTVDDRCTLKHAISLINLNQDPKPTIDMLNGKYVLEDTLQIYPGTEISIVCTTTSVGYVEITWKNTNKEEQVNKTNSVFQISGRPKLTISGIHFVDISGVDCVFDCFNSVELDIEMDKTTFDNVVVAKSIVSNLQNAEVKSVVLNGMTITKSSPIIEFEKKSQGKEILNIPISMNDSYIHDISDGIVKFYDPFDMMTVTFSNNIITKVSETPVFQLQSKDTRITAVSNNTIFQNEVSLFDAQKSVSKFIFTRNYVHDNIIPKKLIHTAKYLFELQVDPLTSYVFKSIDNRWERNEFGHIRFEVLEAKRKQNATNNVIKFQGDHFYENDLRSSGPGLISLIDPRPASISLSQLSLSQMNVMNNDVTKSPGSFGSLAFLIKGELTAEINGGEYENNIGNNGGAVTIADNTKGAGELSLKVSKVIFRNNSVLGTGGALLFSRGQANARMLLDTCTFHLNSAENAGALFFHSFGKSSEFNMTSTSFTKNRAARFGGAIVTGQDLCFSPDCFNFLRSSSSSKNDISSNIAEEGGGGGVYFIRTFLPLKYIDFSVIHNNTGKEIGGNNVLTSPESIQKRNSKDDKIYIDCLQTLKGIGCKTTEKNYDKKSSGSVTTLEFYDGYGSLLTKRTMVDFFVGLEFGRDLDNTIAALDPIAPLQFSYKVKVDVTGHNSFKNEEDGWLILLNKRYPVTLVFQYQLSFWQKYHVVILILILVFGCCCMCCFVICGCCCVLLLLRSVLKDSSTFEGMSIKKLRKSLDEPVDGGDDVEEYLSDTGNYKINERTPLKKGKKNRKGKKLTKKQEREEYKKKLRERVRKKREQKRGREKAGPLSGTQKTPVNNKKRGRKNIKPIGLTAEDGISKKEEREDVGGRQKKRRKRRGGRGKKRRRRRGRGRGKSGSDDDDDDDYNNKKEQKLDSLLGESSNEEIEYDDSIQYSTPKYEDNDGLSYVSHDDVENGQKGEDNGENKEEDEVEEESEEESEGEAPGIVIMQSEVPIDPPEEDEKNFFKKKKKAFSFFGGNVGGLRNSISGIRNSISFNSAPQKMDDDDDDDGDDLYPMYPGMNERGSSSSKSKTKASTTTTSPSTSPTTTKTATAEKKQKEEKKKKKELSYFEIMNMGVSPKNDVFFKDVSKKERQETSFFREGSIAKNIITQTVPSLIKNVTGLVQQDGEDSGGDATKSSSEKVLSKEQRKKQEDNVMHDLITAPANEDLGEKIDKAAANNDDIDLEEEREAKERAEELQNLMRIMDEKNRMFEEERRRAIEKKREDEQEQDVPRQGGNRKKSSGRIKSQKQSGRRRKPKPVFNERRGDRDDSSGMEFSD